MKKLLLSCALFASMSPLLAYAQHGEDFLIVDSPGGPTTGELYLVLDGRHAFGDARTTQAGPSLLYGFSDRVAFQLDGEYERAPGNGWHYAGTTPSVQFSLTDPDSQGAQVGLTLSHTFAPGGSDGSEVRLGVQAGPDDKLFAANLFATHDGIGGTEPGAAIGYRRGIAEGLALSVEAEGPLRRVDGAQVLAALHFDPSPAWALKLGVGGERGSDGYEPFVQARAYVRLGAARRRAD